MNLDIVKEEPSTNAITQGFDEAISQEMSFDIAKAEVKTLGHYEPASAGEACECEETLSPHSSEMNLDVVKEKPKNWVFCTNDKAQDDEDEGIECKMRPPSIDFDRIIFLKALLQDYERVATSGISWLWHAPDSILPSVSCPRCGIWFHGTNRMLALVKHIQSNHSRAALQLMVLVMDDYGVLIRHMERVLKCEIEMLVQRHL